MKKLILSIALLSIVSLGIYSCTKESSQKIVNSEEVNKTHKRSDIKITISFDIARKKCDKDGDGEGCECGFGLCKAQIANPGSSRASSVLCSFISPNQLKLDFDQNINNLRSGENFFIIDEDLQVSNEICNLFGISSLTLTSGSYEYNPNENSVVINTSN
jgi:hypothetical protein